MKLLARELGFSHVIEVDPLDTIAFPGGEIVAVPFLGEHNDLPFAKSAYLISAGEQRLLFAADSNCLDRRMYENLCAEYGPNPDRILGHGMHRRAVVLGVRAAVAETAGAQALPDEAFEGQRCRCGFEPAGRGAIRAGLYLCDRPRTLAAIFHGLGAGR